MDPYEQWKQMGRPGGSFDVWMAEQNSPPSPIQQQQQQTGTSPTQTQNPGAPQFAPGTNWGSLTPEQAGIQAWGAEIGGNNVITANMSPEQRARWSMEHIEGFDEQSKNSMSREQAFNQWMAWQDKYDAKCPPDRPYQAEDGSGCVEKPDNSNKGYMEAGIMDENGNWTPGGRKNQPGAQGQPAKPPEPVTFGNNLTMTGNPMQDMLINQFNTGQNSTYGQGNNIFGLGEDRAVGGTGANADMTGGNQTAKAQTLNSGGLWWGQGDFNSGFDASKKNSEEANAASPAVKPPAQSEPAPQQAPNMEALTKSDPAASSHDRRNNLGRRPRNVSGMLYNQFSPQSGGFF